MAATVNHVFTSPIADGTNTQLVRPSNWNSGHVVSLNVVASEAPTLVPYTGASTRVDLNSNWLSNAHGVILETGDFTRTAADGVLIYDLKNLCFALDSYGGARLQIGQELYTVVYNDSGSQINNGTAVYQNSSARIEYVSGKFGDYPTIRLAQANADATSDVIGICTMDIPNLGFGFVTAFGVVNDLDTSAWASGDELYLSAATPGLLTNVSPTTPNRSVTVGHVIRSHATEGNIRLDIDAINNLSDLNDVNIASPSNGDQLIYNGAGSVWENGAPAAQPINFSAGTTSNALSAVTFGNAGGVSFGLSGSVITAVAPAGGGGITNINVSAGTTSNNLSALTFSNSNGVSFGLNGSVITASAAGGGGAALSAGTQSVNTGTVNFANSNGITFGMSGSNQITASHNGLTTARASNDAIGLNTALTANGVAWTVNSAGLSLNVPAFLTTAAQSNHSHGNPTLALTNLTGTTASASNGLTLSLSGNAAQTVQPVAASGSNGSFAFSTLSFGALNGMTFYTSNGSIVASYTDAGAGGGVNFSAGSTSSALGAVTFSNSNGVSFGLGTGASAGVITASVNAGGGGFTGSYYKNLPGMFNSQTVTLGNSTSHVFPFDLKEAESFGFMRFPHTVSMASTSFASTANSTFSYNQQETHNIVLYTRGTGANSMSLQSVYSTSASLRMSINIQRNSTNNISVTHGFTYPVSNGTSSQSFSYAATNSSNQISTTHLTVFTGMKMFDTQAATSLSGAQFWMAYGYSTTQTTQGTAALSAARLLHSNLMVSFAANTVGNFGIANNASVQWFHGHGSFSTAGGATTASIPLSAISSSAAHPMPFLQMMSI